MHERQASKDHGTPIDALPSQESLATMLNSHINALQNVRGALGDLDAAAHAVAAAFQSGATIHYAAAGSSGLMALADASELPGTFKVPANQIRICMAGGVPADGHMPGGTEDDEAEANRAAESVRDGDVAIVLSASGTTPYALSFARSAQQKGAQIIAIASVANSALLQIADIAIALNTAAEVVKGSTRLGAGTAQKVALNMISTQAGVLLGHVHDGLMVNLHPDNIKLRQRARDIVAQISGVEPAVADAALELADYDTKLATLIATGINSDAARQLLLQHNGRLHECLNEAAFQIETTN